MQKRQGTRIKPASAMDVTVYELKQDLVSGVVVDLSTKGAQVSIDRSVEVGSMICLRLGEVEVVGRVLRVIPEGKRYLVGIQLEHSLKRINQLRALNNVLAQEAVRLQREAQTED